MKPEPNDEPVADPVTMPPSLPQAQGAIAAGGGVLPPATAVFHDQVVQLVGTDSFLNEISISIIGLAENG
jgi:hypothetical protein